MGRHGYRDLDYPTWRVAIELDGRPAHDGAFARDRDLERDLDAMIEDGRVTIRLGWGQVYERPCATAQKVARLLTRQGWRGATKACPDC